MRVAIRVDASQAVGTGHVRRCLALAEALRTAGADIVFLSRNLDVDVPALVDAQGFALTQLPRPAAGFVPDVTIPHAAWAEVPVDVDIAQTLAALAVKPDWVVIDHYAFDGRWHDAIRSRLAGKIAVVDDLADRTIDGDVLIDHNPSADHARKYEGRLSPRVRLLGGPNYALLGPAYATAHRYTPRERVESIGIFLGGVDRPNWSSLVLRAVDNAGFHGPVEIATTSANPSLTQLLAVAESRPRTSVTIDQPDLAAFLSRHDLQIGAGGGALWERCCIGAPTVALVCAENQRISIKELVRRRVVLGVDAWDREEMLVELATDAIAAAVADFPRRRALHDASIRLVDGKGAARVAGIMGEMTR
jgi:UDP-2,4-diacetamido-2,4,6-trideoxy-beta-L-altropyranose hydrolase